MYTQLQYDDAVLIQIFKWNSMLFLTVIQYCMQVLNLSVYIKHDYVNYHASIVILKSWQV